MKLNRREFLEKTGILAIGSAITLAFPGLSASQTKEELLYGGESGEGMGELGNNEELSKLLHDRSDQLKPCMSNPSYTWMLEGGNVSEFKTCKEDGPFPWGSA